MPVATLHAVNGHSMTNVPDGMEIAILRWVVSGVWSVCSGSYPAFTAPPQAIPAAIRQIRLIGKCAPAILVHAEAVRIVYDPSVISYEQLLQVFWENHDPAQGMRQGNDHGTQYRSAIYPLTPEQDAAARASLERFQAAMLAADDDRRITTEIANATPFYYAEDDHQQYLHKTRMVTVELAELASVCRRKHSVTGTNVDC